MFACPLFQLQVFASPLNMKLALLSITLILLIVAHFQETVASEVEQLKAGRSFQQTINCASACDYRCSKANAHDNCIKYCNICCQKCDCVPPGTSGNKEQCPCYNNMKNSKGRSKCP